MILILVRFMQIGRAPESWQIYHKALARFMDLPALACTSNLHEPHQNKNHSLINVGKSDFFYENELRKSYLINVLKNNKIILIAKKCVRNVHVNFKTSQINQIL